ncbi:hypothetical protein C7212DRAFT_331753, partial [Tuber magnatum]
MGRLGQALGVGPLPSLPLLVLLSWISVLDTSMILVRWRVSQLMPRVHLPRLIYPSNVSIGCQEATLYRHTIHTRETVGVSECTVRSLVNA